MAIIAQDNADEFEKLDLQRVGVLVGTGMGGLQVFQDGVQNLVERGYKKISPFFIPYAITNMCGWSPPVEDAGTRQSVVKQVIENRANALMIKASVCCLQSDGVAWLCCMVRSMRPTAAQQAIA